MGDVVLLESCTILVLAHAHFLRYRYFTLAHEIAHNIVGPHNSEHEFYFSAISEASLPAFVAYISSRT